MARDEAWQPLKTPDMVGQDMQINLDGAIFRLVGSAYRYSDRELTLTFEDEIIYLLKRKKGERRANRSKVTRAQFVLSVCCGRSSRSARRSSAPS